MKRSEWMKEVACNCQFTVVVSGGAMCNEGGKYNYCDFKQCPRIELERKDER